MQGPRFLLRREILKGLGLASTLGKTLPLLALSDKPATPSYRSEGHLDRTRIRADFAFEPGLAYLNTSSLGAVPRPALEHITQVFQTLETNPTARGYGDLEQAMDDVRAKLAALIGCEHSELVVTNSTTDGMNLVAQGIGLSKGQRVLTTDQEHPGGSDCWAYYARRYGVEIQRVRLPPQAEDSRQIISLFEERLSPQTAVVSLSHVTFSTGTLMPIREIADLAHANGSLCVVDGAQAAGSMAVDVKALGCDAYASCGHKWLLGPAGTGFLYISAKQRRAIDPIVLQDGEKAYSGSTGVRNIPGILGLASSMDYLREIGQETIWKHNMNLRELAYAGLLKINRIQILSSRSGPFATPLLSFSLPSGVDNHAFQALLLRKYKLQVKVLPGDVVPRGIRISPHIFNHEEDVSRFLRAVGNELST